jgi:hypothetical protein
MEPMSDHAKLAELRARTDRELQVLIERELERALPMAHVAANRESAFYCEADRAYRKVLTLLPKAPDTRRGQRARIEATMKELRLLLDQVPAPAKAQRRSASFAAGA